MSHQAATLCGGCNGGEERGKGKEQNHKIREHITEVLEAA
jgi:hypothetical protein